MTGNERTLIKHKSFMIILIMVWISQWIAIAMNFCGHIWMPIKMGHAILPRKSFNILVITPLNY